MVAGLRSCSRSYFRLVIALATLGATGTAASAQTYMRPPDSEVQRLRASALPPGEQARRAEALATSRVKRGDALGAAEAMNHVAFSAARMQDQTLWERAGERELALCRRARDLLCEARATNTLALADTNAGRMESALDRLRTTIRLFDQANEPRRAVMTRLNAALVRFELGDYAGALADLDAIEPAFREGDGRAHLPHLLISRSQLLLELDRPGEARQVVQEALSLGEDALARGPQLVNGVVEARSLLGRAEAQLGSAEASVRAHQAAIATAERSRSPDDRFWANFRLAESLADLGRPAEALPIVKAVEAGTGTLKPTDRKRFFERAAAIYAATGRIGDAVAAQRKAAALQDQIYRANLVGSLGRAQKDVLVAEREAEARRVTVQAARERERAGRELLQTRVLAVTIALALIAASVALFLWFRFREQRRRHEQVLAERARMAGEIHDTLMQGFTGVVQQLHLARRVASSRPDEIAPALDQATDAARRTLNEARAAVWDLREHDLADETLRERLDAIARDYASELDPEVTVSARDWEAVAPERADGLVRVVREAVGNAARHAAAKRIRIFLQRQGPKLVLRVEDDGKGFDVPDPTAGGRDGHWGLVGMRERIARLGGSLAIESAPGRGTVVTAELPA